MKTIILKGWSALAVAAALVAAATLRAAEDSAATTFAVPQVRAVDSLDVVAEGGRVHLLLGRTGGEAQAGGVWYVGSDDGGGTWSAPVELPVGAVRAGKMGRGNDARLTVRGARMLAAWTAAGEGPMKTGALIVACSADEGRTWQGISAPAALAGEGEAAVGCRFPALAATAQAFHAIWIHASGETRALAYARWDFGTQTWTPTRVLDPQICACCWNRLVVSAGRLTACYRNMNPSDMYTLSSADEGVTWAADAEAGIAPFGWKYNGCPHVGAGLATVGKMYWATVWSGHSAPSKEAPTEGYDAPAADAAAPACCATGKEQAALGEKFAAGAYVTTSTDGGQTWRAPAALGTSGFARFTDVACGSATEALAAWSEARPDGTGVYVMRSTDGGETWAPQRALAEATERNVTLTHPRVVWSGGRFLVFWTRTAGKGAGQLEGAAVAAPGVELSAK